MRPSDFGWLSGDLIAGITGMHPACTRLPSTHARIPIVALVLVPQSMSYAIVTRLPCVLPTPLVLNTPSSLPLFLPNTVSTHPSSVSPSTV